MDMCFVYSRSNAVCEIKEQQLGQFKSCQEDSEIMSPLFIPLLANDLVTISPSRQYPKASWVLHKQQVLIMYMYLLSVYELM